jgi:hypothetical protein
MSHSTTAGHISNNMLQLHCTETIIFVSQLKTHLQATLIQHFPEIQDVIEQSACQLRSCYQKNGKDTAD